MATLDCRGCGAELSYVDNGGALTCQYCGLVNGSGAVAEQPSAAIDKIIPFGLTVAQMEQRVSEYMVSGDYTPEDLLDAATIVQREMLYVPAHLFTVKFEAAWTASFGFSVEVTQGSGDSKRTTTELQFLPQSGQDVGEFIVAGYAGQARLVSPLQPTALLEAAANKGRLRDFAPELLAGAETEAAVVPEAAALAAAEPAIEAAIEKSVKQHGQGSEQKDWHWASNKRVSHCTAYLPVGHLVFEYQGKHYHVWLDGVDGYSRCADPLPEDEARKAKAGGSHVVWLLGLIVWVICLFPWNFSFGSLATLVLACWYGYRRERAVLRHSREKREARLLQIKGSSSAAGRLAAGEVALANAYKEPGAPWITSGWTHFLAFVLTLAGVMMPAYDRAHPPYEWMTPDGTVRTVTLDGTSAGDDTLIVVPEQDASVTINSDDSWGVFEKAGCRKAGARCRVSGQVKDGEFIKVTQVTLLQRAQGDEPAPAPAEESPAEGVAEAMPAESALQPAQLPEASAATEKAARR